MAGSSGASSSGAGGSGAAGSSGAGSSGAGGSVHAVGGAESESDEEPLDFVRQQMQIAADEAMARQLQQQLIMEQEQEEQARREEARI